MTYAKASKAPANGWGRTNDSFHLLAAAAQAQAITCCLNAEVLYDRAVSTGVTADQLRKMQWQAVADLFFS